MISKIIRKVQQRLGLTKSESLVIIFLSLGLIVGGSVKMFHLDKKTERFDFSESDAFFADASSKMDSILKSEDDSLAAGSPLKYSGKKMTGEAVDINSADAGKLSTVPGIGRVTAQRIVEYRARNGRFRSVDDLRGVKGIGAKKLERLRPYVKVE